MTAPALTAIGVVESTLTDPDQAPKQGSEGAPDAWLVLEPDLALAYEDLAVGTEIVVLTWLHRAQRDVLSVHPRDDRDQPLRGVFSTRSPDRPNPIGLHTVRILQIEQHRVLVQGLEAVDGTPIVDIKSASSAATPATPAPVRPAELRRRDTLQRLEHDVDAWVATADPATGTAYMIPLSFLWDGRDLYVATPADSPTGRNLSDGQRIRAGIGPTRDVVLLEGTATPIEPDQIDPDLAERFAEHTGFEPRAEPQHYLYFRIRPERIQAWREANELEGRELMANGQWLVPSPHAPWA